MDEPVDVPLEAVPVGKSRRRRWPFVAVAVAVLAAGGGVALAVGNGDGDGKVEVRAVTSLASVVDETQGLGTARIAVEMTGGPTEEAGVRQEGVIDFRRKRLRLVSQGGTGPMSEVVATEDGHYVRFDGRWARFPQVPEGSGLPAAGGLLGAYDSARLLDGVRAVSGEPERLAREMVRDEPAQHLRFTVDPAATTSTVLGALPTDDTVDAWIDDRGRLRRVEFGLPAGGGSIRIEFWDFGAPVDILVPSEAELVDQETALFGSVPEGVESDSFGEIGYTMVNGAGEQRATGPYVLLAAGDAPEAWELWQAPGVGGTACTTLEAAAAPIGPVANLPEGIEHHDGWPAVCRPAPERGGDNGAGAPIIVHSWPSIPGQEQLLVGEAVLDAGTVVLTLADGTTQEVAVDPTTGVFQTVVPPPGDPQSIALADGSATCRFEGEFALLATCEA